MRDFIRGIFTAIVITTLITLSFSFGSISTQSEIFKNCEQLGKTIVYSKPIECKVMK